MRIGYILALLLLVSAGNASAESKLAGKWAVRSNGQPLMIVTLSHDSSGWHAGWSEPTTFSTDGGLQSLYDEQGPIAERTATTANERDGAIKLYFPKSSVGNDAEDMTFLVLPDGTARLSFDEMAGAAFVLDRAKPGEALAQPDHDKIYPIDQHWTTNAEMTAIFDADQGARMSDKIDWSVVGPQDDARRARTKALLDAGNLQSGTDYWHAAFIFQHGQGDDYLLAHALALVAIARGRPDATWIAAATLDRYLQTIGKKQIYGTQFLTPVGGTTTQEPYDRTLISDALRTASGVPTRAAQAKQLKQFDAQAHGAAGTK